MIFPVLDSKMRSIDVPLLQWLLVEFALVASSPVVTTQGNSTKVWHVFYFKFCIEDWTKWSTSCRGPFQMYCNNKSALLQVLAWHGTRDKPLPETNDGNVLQYHMLSLGHNESIQFTCHFVMYKYLHCSYLCDTMIHYYLKFTTVRLKLGHAWVIVSHVFMWMPLLINTITWILVDLFYVSIYRIYHR